MKSKEARRVGRSQPKVSPTVLGESLLSRASPRRFPPSAAGPDCLDSALLERLARGERPAGEWETAEAHLVGCQHCCNELARAADREIAARASKLSRTDSLVLSLAPLFAVADAAEPLRLAASSADQASKGWVSHQEEDVRVIVHHRDGELRAVVERAGRPARGVAVRLERSDGGRLAGFEGPSKTDRRGEVVLGDSSRLGLAKGGADLVLAVRIPSERRESRPRPAGGGRETGKRRSR